MLKKITIIFILFLAGCASPKFSFDYWQEGKFNKYWPNPPDPKRIEMIGIIPDQENDKELTPQEKFLRWLVGERDKPRPLLTPYAVISNGEGLVWITDTEGHAVHKFILGSMKQEVWTSAGTINFVAPLGLAIDRIEKKLFLSDSVLKKVFILDFDGRLLGEIVSPGGFERPTGLAIDNFGNLYVADTKKGVVYKFDSTGSLIKSITSGVSPDGKFNLPVNLSTDQSGNLFVVDSMNFRVEQFSSEGVSLGTIGELGDAPGYFARPRGIAVDSKGHVYVADAAFSNVQIFDQDGQLLLFFGESGFEPGEFMLPAGLFFDQDDRLYVVDAYNQRVQVFQYLHAEK